MQSVLLDGAGNILRVIFPSAADARQPIHWPGFVRVGVHLVLGARMWRNSEVSPGGLVRIVTRPQVRCRTSSSKRGGPVLRRATDQDSWRRVLLAHAHHFACATRAAASGHLPLLVFRRAHAMTN